MRINEAMEKLMNKHKSEIKIFQFSTTLSISSIIYAEYIRMMKKKIHPVECIHVAEVHALEELLLGDTSFIITLKENFIDSIINRPLFKKYSNAPEFMIFNDNNIESLKTLFSLQIIPSIVDVIPRTISKKFQLSSETNNSYFRQDSKIDLFGRTGIQENCINYIIDQTILHMLLAIPSISKTTVIPESNEVISLAKEEILTIQHVNEICPIHFNSNIIDSRCKNNSLKETTEVDRDSMFVMDLFTFTTSTTFTNICDDSFNGYSVSSNNFNKISITKLNEMGSGEV